MSPYCSVYFVISLQFIYIYIYIYIYLVRLLKISVINNVSLPISHNIFSTHIRSYDHLYLNINYKIILHKSNLTKQSWYIIRHCRISDLFQHFEVQIVIVNSNSLVQFSRKSKPLKVPQQELDGGSLGKINIKHCKIICRLELDTGSSKMKSDVEFNSTLDQQVLMTRKCNRCVRDLQANIIGWKYGSKNQFKRIRKSQREGERERERGRERERENKEKDKRSSFIWQEATSFIHISATSKPHAALNVDTTMPYDLHELRPCVQYEWRQMTAASSGDNPVLLVGI